MWVSFRYIFDECFQQDDVRIVFDENDGMYFLEDDNVNINKILHVTANSHRVRMNEISRDEYKNREINNDWENYEIDFHISISSLWELYYKYFSEPILLSEIDMIDDLENSTDSESSSN